MTEPADASPRPVLTGRALVLGAVVLLLVVLLAAPVNRYLTSRHAIGQAAQQPRRRILPRGRTQGFDEQHVDQTRKDEIAPRPLPARLAVDELYQRREALEAANVQQCR